MSRQITDQRESQHDDEKCKSVTKYRKVIWVTSCLTILMSVKFSRSYVLACFGNSDAMYFLACEYGRDNSIYVRRNNYKSNYWIRKSASKGNLGAIITIKNKWGITNYQEVL